MAEPKGSLERQAAWRESIKSKMLLNRLTQHAEGEIELSNSQIKAIEILLKKTMPDLKAIEHSGETGTRLIININKATDG